MQSYLSNLITRTLKRAYKYKKFLKEETLIISQWSLEQKIINRKNVSMKKAAQEWLERCIYHDLTYSVGPTCDDDIQKFIKLNKI